MGEGVGDGDGDGDGDGEGGGEGERGGVFATVSELVGLFPHPPSDAVISKRMRNAKSFFITSSGATRFCEANEDVIFVSRNIRDCERPK